MTAALAVTTLVALVLGVVMILDARPPKQPRPYDHEKDGL